MSDQGKGMTLCTMCNDTQRITITGEESAGVPCSWCPRPPATISSVRVAIIGGHAHVGVWNRGGKAGELVVDARDAKEFIRRLSPEVLFADSKEAEELVREFGSSGR